MQMRGKNVQCLGLVPGRGRPMLSPAIVTDKLRRCLALAAAAAMISALCLGTSDPANASSRATTSAHAVDKSGASVEIGIPVVGGLQGVSNAVGSNGVTEPSGQQEQEYIQAIVDYVNGHGGLLGHKIAPIYYTIANAGSTTAAAADQGACVDWTQDHHVFAGMAANNHTDTLTACLQAAHAITFDAAGFIPYDDVDLAKFPFYATAGTLSLTRVAAVEVNGLFKAGYFGNGKTDSDTKIGLLAYNTAPYTRAINQVLKPALARHGLKLTDEQEVAPVESVADAIALQTPITNAALRFKAEGINHVIFFENQGAIVYNWEAAETSESYFPRLGVTTNDSVGTKSSPSCSFCGSVVKSWTNAVGIGWSPTNDLSTPTVNATAALCNRIVESAGASAAVAPQFWAYCDQLFVFAAAVNAGGQLTPKAAIQGLSKIKNLTPAELVGPVNYQNGRRDGAGYGQFMAWKMSCECMQYTSRPFPLSTLENG
jgi:ABC-type branched-subunit amino acid transport system substrate-binding protein